MKKRTRKGRIIIFCITICVIASVLYLHYRHRTVINLGPLNWKIVHSNTSVLKSNSGKILVGPSHITLWGKHPYVYGQDSTTPFFVIDLRTETVRSFEPYKGLDIETVPPNKYVTFYDLHEHEWGKVRLRQLRANLKKKGVR